MHSRTWPLASVAAFLADAQGPDQAKLRIVTGGRQAGKTNFCRQLAAEASGRGLHVAGLLSPAVFEGREKTAIDLCDLTSKEQRCLASLRPDHSNLAGGCRWQLDDDALEWGNQVLAAIDKCDLLILDELGPLELLEGAGLTQAFSLLDAGRYGLSCTVIRPALLPAALERWPQADVFAVAEGVQ